MLMAYSFTNLSKNRFHALYFIICNFKKVNNILNAIFVKSFEI